MKKERQLFAEKFIRDLIFVQTTNDDLAPWDRNKIVAVLINETGLDYKVADKISEEVQNVIFSSGLKVVTSEFIRELVNAKLLEHDLEDVREKNKRLGLSLFDVNSLLKYPVTVSPLNVLSPENTAKVIAESVKRQFVLTELLNEEQRNSHITGKYHVHGLNSPDKMTEIYINAFDFRYFSYASGGVVIVKPETVFEFIDNLKKIHMLLTEFVVEGICWFNIEKVLISYNCDEDTRRKLLVDFINFVGKTQKVCCSIVAESKETAKAIASLITEKSFFNIEVKVDKENYFVSPFVSLFERRFTKTLFIGDVITVNLPRIGLHTITNKCETNCELNKLFLEIASVFSKKQLYIQKLISVRPGGVLEFLSKAGLCFDNLKFGIALNGLNEWVRLQYSCDLDNDKVFEIAFDFVKQIRSQIQFVAESKKIKLLLMSSAQENVAYRFARMDLKLYPDLTASTVNGDIEESSIFYTRDCGIASSLPASIEQKFNIERQLQTFYDIPFKTIVKSVNSNIEKYLYKISNPAYLVLTLDFSLCYNCMMISQGVYHTCPECFGTEIEIYSCSYGGYSPVSRLNSAFRKEIESFFYYT
jgi:anaerobic ribonucleoside-triphosphate reductase